SCKEATGLEPVQRMYGGRGVGHVEALPPDHAERRLGELAADLRERVRERKPECFGQQGITGEDRNSLAVLGPHRRASAALRVVVEGRQIVVNERERVHELKRRCCRKPGVGVTTRGL